MHNFWKNKIILIFDELFKNYSYCIYYFNYQPFLDLSPCAAQPQRDLRLRCPSWRHLKGYDQHVMQSTHASFHRALEHLSLASERTGIGFGLRVTAGDGAHEELMGFSLRHKIVAHSSLTEHGCAVSQSPSLHYRCRRHRPLLLRHIILPPFESHDSRRCQTTQSSSAPCIRHG